MTLYLAAPFNWRDRAKVVRTELQARGFTVNSRWLDNHLEEFDLMTPADKWREAKSDLTDVAEADGFVLFNGPSTSGGLHIELGYALALGKPVWLLGDPSTIFHHHPLIRVVHAVREI